MSRTPDDFVKTLIEWKTTDMATNEALPAAAAAVAVDDDDDDGDDG